MSNIILHQSNALALPVNREQFVTQNLPVQCIKQFSKVNNAIAAYKAECVSLAILKKTYSEDFTTAYISLWIINMNEYLNVSRPMKDEQIEETAYLILSTYYYLKLSDITLVFSRAKRGEFGPLYESIDGTKILSWFEKYANERADAIENYTTREHYKTKQPDAKRSSDVTDIRTAMHRAKGFETILRSEKE